MEKLKTEIKEYICSTVQFCYNENIITLHVFISFNLNLYLIYNHKLLTD